VIEGKMIYIAGGVLEVQPGHIIVLRLITAIRRKTWMNKPPLKLKDGAEEHIC